jgi:hypothetical protein
VNEISISMKWKTFININYIVFLMKTATKKGQSSGEVASPKGLSCSKKRALGTTNMMRPSDSACRPNVSFIESLNSVNAYFKFILSSTSSSSAPTEPTCVGMCLFPFVCCDYDLYLMRRLKIENSQKITTFGFSTPGECLLVLSQMGVSRSQYVQAQFESFLESCAIQPKPFSDMSASNLLILLAFLSFSSKSVVHILIHRNLLHSLIGSLLSMLTEKKDCIMLASAIACLAFVVENHSSLSSIMTESNISQLMKLCITRALYPTSEAELGSNVRSEYEIGASQLGLDRLLDIPIVISSVAASKEVDSFIRKWWQRLYASSMNESGSFENPESCKSGKVPALRTVIEILANFVSKLPYARNVLKNLLSKEDSVGIDFLSVYVTSRDCRTAMAAMKLMMIILRDLKLSRVSDLLKSDILYRNVSNICLLKSLILLFLVRYMLVFVLVIASFAVYDTVWS